MFVKQMEYLNEILKSYNNNIVDCRKLFNYIVAFETKTTYYPNINSIVQLNNNDTKLYRNKIFYNLSNVSHYDGNNHYVYTIDLSSNVCDLSKHNNEIIELIAIDRLQQDNEKYKFEIYIYYQNTLRNSWINYTMDLMQNIPMCSFHYISDEVIKDYAKCLMMKIYNNRLTFNNNDVVNIVDFNNSQTLETFGYYLSDSIEKETLKEIMIEYIKNENNNLTDNEIKNKVDNMINYIINIQCSSIIDDKLRSSLNDEIYYVTSDDTIKLLNPFVNKMADPYGGIIKLPIKHENYKPMKTNIKLYSLINDCGQFICYISEKQMNKYINKDETIKIIN